MSDIVLDKSYVENLMSQMTEDQKIQALAKFMGYGKVPPSIEEFIMNDYYLGKVFNPKLPNGLYPYWLKVLKKIFPNPVQCRYPFVSLGGAIGQF